MARVGYNPDNVTIKSDSGAKIDMAHLVHFQVAAADAVAADTDGVHADMNLGAAVQNVTTGITNPAVPRGLTVKGNVSGITGNVTITGTDYAGAALSEVIALNGASAVAGAKAFRSVTNIALPVQVHTPVAQVETIAVTAGASAEGTLEVSVTSALFAEPVVVEVPVTTDDNTTAEVAALIRAALEADEDIDENFTVGGADANVILTAKVPAANDATLALALDEADSTSVTVGASANTTAGVPYDKVQVGWSDILGLPDKLAHNTLLSTFVNNVLESTAATVTVSATVLASNTLDPHSALAGTILDAYYIV